jgi:predicted DNA-binding protein (UPF0278 family)
MDDMTNRALQASPIFSDYIAQEQRKINASIKTAEELALESSEIVNSFEDFQIKVNNSLKLKESFTKLQHIFRTNEKYASTVDPLFVEAVLMLRIEE